MFKQFAQLDRQILGCFAALGMIGFVLMFSASVDFADKKYGNPLFHFERQLFFWCLALVGAVIVLKIPLSFWKKYSAVLLFVALTMLALVLVPFIGKEVNGSRRWISLGLFNLQVSEFAKLGIIIYLADYLYRRQQEVRTNIAGMLKPMAVLGVAIALLLLEPDFGSVVVLGVASMAMIFLSGVRMSYFFGLIAVMGTVGVLAIGTSAYRMRRLQCFLDPWKDAQDCGYQLTQSLIAIGRGEWLGTGLGNSVQKLFYLPESHTDFVFAILAEELGLLGGIIVIALFALLISRILKVARHAEENKNFFGAYLVYGIGVIFATQVFINIGVNTGLLPTKGLTLPFFSYGGSSLIVSITLIAFVLRVDFENQTKKSASRQTKKKLKKKTPVRFLRDLVYEKAA